MVILSDGLPFTIGRRWWLELGQFREHVRKPYTGNDIVSDPDVVEPDGNEAGRIKLGGIGRGGDVVQIDAAQIEHEIGAFDDLPRFRIRRRAGVHAGKLRVALADDALFHERCSERTTQRFDRLLHLLLQAEPQNCERWKRDDGLRLADTLGDERHRLL
jgi:hypothetical protein